MSRVGSFCTAAAMWWNLHVAGGGGVGVGAVRYSNKLPTQGGWHFVALLKQTPTRRVLSDYTTPWLTHQHVNTQHTR